jgi:hypothetical protein
MCHGLLRRLTLACLVLPPLFAVASAEEVAFPNLGEVVPGRKNLTYLDLAKQIVPDLAKAEFAYEGRQLITMRQISGPNQGDEAPAMVSLSTVAALSVKTEGKERLALLFDLGRSSDRAEGFAVLALYDDGREPKLLDAVNVANDRDTYFLSPGSLAVGPAMDVLTIMSTHFNSNQAYMTTVLIVARAEKFEVIDTIYTFDEKQCAFERTQGLAFRTVENGKAYGAIEATVTETTAPTGESCDNAAPEPSSRVFSATYSWDEAKSGYARNSDALEKLADENSQRF